MSTATLAVFGGSFNPPHVAHQMACLWVLETQPVDGLLLVPTYRHPFDKDLAPFEDRLAMCRLAAAPLGSRVEVSALEASLGEPSLTLHTLEALARERPGARFRLVIGTDLLAERAKWYRWDAIERLAPPIVIGRAGYAGGGADVLDLPAVSSTDVRARVARGEDPTGWVSASVSRYIAEKGLYHPAPLR